MRSLSSLLIDERIQKWLFEKNIVYLPTWQLCSRYPAVCPSWNLASITHTFSDFYTGRALFFLGTDKKRMFSDYLIDAPCVIIVFLLQYHIL